MTAAVLTIDLDALARNFRTLGREAAGAAVAPVVKSDGYGLGAGAVARRLWAEGARAFFVARLSEGLALRAALPGLAATIFVLDGVGPGETEILADAELTPVLNSLDDADRWRPSGRPAALHADTGMNRLGVTADEAARCRDLPIVHVMSHLACAAEPGNPANAVQLARFAEARALFPDATASLAASAGTFLGADYHFDVIRPGISLYGGGPRETPDDRIAAVVTLEAPILQVRDLQPGDAVGYGRAYVAHRPTRIGVVAAGYSDGVLRRSMGKAGAFVGGAPAPMLIVSMDLIAVDLTACPDASAGDLVELLGPNALLDNLAIAAGSVAHECLVRLSARAQRAYRGKSG